MKANTRTQKRSILNELGDNPLIERACKKIGIARSTFYRWCDADSEFKAKAEIAIEFGRGKLNDFAESKLMEAISTGNVQAIRYWLDHNSKRYALVSKSELKRLRFFESIVNDLLDAAVAKDDHAVLRYITEMRKQAEEQIEEEKNRTGL